MREDAWHCSPRTAREQFHSCSPLLALFLFLQSRAWLGLYMVPHLRDFALEEILYQ